jgi:hypothetical protein
MAFMACPQCGKQINVQATSCKYCRWQNPALTAEAMSIQHTDPGQDMAALQSVANEVRRVLTSDEEIIFIALQTQSGGMARRDAAVITTNRMIFFKRPMVGSANFSDHSWQDIKDVRLKQGMTASDLVITLIGGKVEAMGWLEKAQAQRAYSFAQQREQEWREKRRLRDMEEKRAAAGGMTITMPPQATTPVSAPAAVEDPVARLAKAKAMLDQGLISQAEYDDLKSRILSAI